jgi:hypothetical protein
MREPHVRAGALSIRPFQVSRWRLRRTRHPWVVNADLVRRYGLKGVFVGRVDRPGGGLNGRRGLDIAEISTVSLVMRSGEVGTETRLACGAQRYKLWTFVDMRLRTIN